MLPDIVQSGLKLWCDDFVFICFFVFFLSTVCCAVFILLIWVVSRPRAAKNAQTSHWGALLFFFPPSLVVLWAFAKHLGCLFPFVCVQCCAFDLCCAQLFSPLIIRCLSYLKKKKARGHLPEERCIMRSLACFLSLVLQWEASQTNPLSPALFYILWYILTNWKWLPAAFFVLNELNPPRNPLHPEIQNCVRISCKHWWFVFTETGVNQGAIDSRKTTQSWLSSSAFILVKLQLCTWYRKAVLTKNLPSFGFFFLELHAEAITKDSIFFLDVCVINV